MGEPFPGDPAERLIPLRGNQHEAGAGEELRDLSPLHERATGFYDGGRDVRVQPRARDVNATRNKPDGRLISSRNGRAGGGAG